MWTFPGFSRSKIPSKIPKLINNLEEYLHQAPAAETEVSKYVIESSFLCLFVSSSGVFVHRLCSYVVF